MIEFRQKDFSLKEGHYTGPKDMDKVPGAVEVIGKSALGGALAGSAVGASKAGKLKTACMLTGLTLMFFQDIPFVLFGVTKVSTVIITIATVLSVISGVQYYEKNKKYLTDNM